MNEYNIGVKQRKPIKPATCAIELCLEGIQKIAFRMLPYAPAGMDMSDLIGYGVIGCYDAWSRFEPSRGIKFWTYAEPRVWGAMGDGIRQWHMVHHRNKRGIRIVPDGYLDQICDPDHDARYEKSGLEHDLSTMWALVDDLPDLHRLVLLLRYRDGEPQATIMQITGLNKHRISAIESEAISALRQAVDDKIGKSSSCDRRELAPAIFGGQDRRCDS